VYADINGLKMFYEIRGPSDPAKVPVVLLHGAISATGTSFGPLPDLLAQTRQVIAVEQQGHGRTADIDRPMSVQAMADDTLALLASLGIGQAAAPPEQDGQRGLEEKPAPSRTREPPRQLRQKLL